MLIIVDSFSKWIEVMETRVTTSKKTIELLRSIFARYGFPKVIVTDNGPQFSSSEFRNFCKSIGACLKSSAPYHRRTNGQAERSVQTIKSGLKKLLHSNPGISFSRALQNVLFIYRYTPHISTKKAPSEMFFGRRIRNHLDVFSEIHEQKATLPYPRSHFQEGDTVRLRIHPNLNSPWVKGKVVKVYGPRNYLVNWNGNVFKRHKDQLRTGEEKGEGRKKEERKKMI
jgi:transposase InsO family protein